MTKTERLIATITALSTTNDWDNVKKEWKFIDAFEREDSTCMCGKRPIMNVCVIQNNINQNKAEVGNCCVKKFMDITEGDMYFQNIKKLKKNIKSHLTEKFLDFLFKKQILIEDNYQFYKSFIFNQWTKQSSEDWNKKIEINKMVLEQFTQNAG